MVRRKYSKKEILLSIISVLTMVIILTFYIWYQTAYIRLGYQIRELESKLNHLEKEVEKLEVKKAFLLSLDRVEKIAKQKLDLKEPKEEQIVFDEFQP